SNTTCDTSGNGEGEVYLGSTSVSIGGGNPTGAFGIGNLPATAVGRKVTATATDARNSTSEFSACVTVQQAGSALAETGGSTVVGEGAGTDVFTLVLNAQPSSNVTISFNTGSQLQTIPDAVFTPANWNIAQIITVAAVDDAVAE